MSGLPGRSPFHGRSSRRRTSTDRSAAGEAHAAIASPPINFARVDRLSYGSSQTAQQQQQQQQQQFQNYSLGATPMIVGATPGTATFPPTSPDGLLSMSSPTLSYATGSMSSAIHARGRFFQRRSTPRTESSTLHHPSRHGGVPDTATTSTGSGGGGATITGSVQYRESRPSHGPGEPSGDPTTMGDYHHPSGGLYSRRQQQQQQPSTGTGGVLGTAIPTATPGISSMTPSSFLSSHRQRHFRLEEDNNSSNMRASNANQFGAELEAEASSALIQNNDNDDVNDDDGENQQKQANPAEPSKQNEDDKDKDDTPKKTLEGKEYKEQVKDSAIEPSDEEDTGLRTLRALVHHTMGCATTKTSELELVTPSPSAAAFYASILYSKTQSPRDAYICAKAFASNDERRRAVMMLERAGLLGLTTHHRYANATDNIIPLSHSVPVELRMESTLLAAQCLTGASEWEEALILLEDVSRYPLPNQDGPPNHHVLQDRANMAATVIEDGHDVRLFQLVQALEPNLNSSSKSSVLDATDGVNVVARLCTLRGICYDELGNSSRAASFFKAALQIDSKCVEALHFLFERHLLSETEERDLVLGLEFPLGYEWLRDVYMARLKGPPNVASFSKASDNQNLSNKHQQQHGAETSQYTFGGITSPPSVIGQQSPSMGISIDTPSVSTVSSADFSRSLKKLSVQRSRLNKSAHLEHMSEGDEGAEEEEAAIVKSTNQTDGAMMSDIEESLRNLHLRHSLSSAPEILALAAIRSYEEYDLPGALSYCNALAAVDPLCPTASYVHIATLVGLRYKRPLFRLAHQLVDTSPKSAQAWYAVGCYYYLCKRYDLAQRHFCRATRLDPRSAECWIAFGTSFAASDESDQALASYRAAQRLHAGSHRPMLYMGMEYLRTNHLSLAGHFLKSAQRMGPSDPLCYNEMGVWSYKKREYAEAAQWLHAALRIFAGRSMPTGSGVRLLMNEDPSDAAVYNGEEMFASTPAVEDKRAGRGNQAMQPPLTSVKIGTDVDTSALHDDMSVIGTSQIKKSPPGNNKGKELSDRECIDLCQDSFWEPTIFNLGQSYRKMRLFEEATVCFEKCLSLCPGSAASYSALGFTKHLTGDIDGAIESYHQALSRKPDDPFSSEMLNRALQEALTMDIMAGDDIDNARNNKPLLSPHPPLSSRHSDRTSRSSFPFLSDSVTPTAGGAGNANATATSFSVATLSSPMDNHSQSLQEESMRTDASNYTLDSEDVDMSAAY